MTAVTITNSCTTMARIERSAMVPKGPQPCRVQTTARLPKASVCRPPTRGVNRKPIHADDAISRNPMGSWSSVVNTSTPVPSVVASAANSSARAWGRDSPATTSTSELPSPRRSALRMTSTEAATTKAPQALRITQVENVRVDQCPVLIQTAAVPMGALSSAPASVPAPSSSRSLALLIPGRRSAVIGVRANHAVTTRTTNPCTRLATPNIAAVSGALPKPRTSSVVARNSSSASKETWSRVVPRSIQRAATPGHGPEHREARARDGGQPAEQEGRDVHPQIGQTRAKPDPCHPPSLVGAAGRHHPFSEIGCRPS